MRTRPRQSPLVGTDADGNSLTFAIVSGVLQRDARRDRPGDLLYRNSTADVLGRRTYTPALNYNGPDSFTFG